MTWSTTGRQCQVDKRAGRAGATLLHTLLASEWQSSGQQVSGLCDWRMLEVGDGLQFTSPAHDS
jgi:hypothetical protein